MKEDDKKVAARRKQILAAATKIFAEKGFQRATIREIARVAGLADGTLYLYFESKTALLLGLFEAAREALPPEIEPAMLDNLEVRDALKTLVTYPLLGFAEDNFELFRVVLAEILVNAELRALYYEKVFGPTLLMAQTSLLRWMEQGKIRTMETHLLSRILCGAIYGLILEQAIGDKLSENDWRQLPDLIAEVILTGIGGGVE